MRENCPKGQKGPFILGGELREAKKLHEIRNNESLYRILSQKLVMKTREKLQRNKYSILKKVLFKIVNGFILCRRLSQPYAVRQMIGDVRSLFLSKA
jgi:hypothetical protein